MTIRVYFFNPIQVKSSAVSSVDHVGDWCVAYKEHGVLLTKGDQFFFYPYSSVAMVSRYERQ